MSWKILAQIMLNFIIIVIGVEICNMAYELLLAYQSQINQIRTFFY